MNKVVMPNCTLDLADQGGTFYAGPGLTIPRQIGNLQKDSRDTLNLTPLLEGRGLGVNDHPKLYRVRINLLPGDLIPKMEDKVFVATHRFNRSLRGYYTIWDEPEQTSGLLATMVLSLHKEYN